MTNVAIQDITPASSATADQVLGVKGGVAKLFSLSALAVGFVVSIGTAPVARTLADKVQEIEVSVIDYGADPTGVAFSTTAFTNAIHSGAKRIRIPAGTYKITNLLVDRSIALVGDGRVQTTINVTTTTTHGMQIIGESALGTGNVIYLSGFKLKYTGTGQPVASGGNNNWSGLYIQRKVIADDVFINSFTNDGAYMAPSDAVESGTTTKGTLGNCVFFATFTNCIFNGNGRDGFALRYGANAETFINCQFSSNTRDGFHQYTDGGATYGSTVIGGQASYNTNIGYNIESGTNINMMGLYAEYNGSSGNSTATGYDTQIIDFYIGDNASRSMVLIGTVLNNSNTHVRAPTSGLNDTIAVFVGGDRIFGSSASHVPHETTTFSALTGTETLAQVITQVNLIRTKLQTAGVVA